MVSCSYQAVRRGKRCPECGLQSADHDYNGHAYQCADLAACGAQWDRTDDLYWPDPCGDCAECIRSMFA